MRILASKADKKKFLLNCGIIPVKGKEELVFEFVNAVVQQICLRDLEENQCSMINFIGPNKETLEKIISIVSKYYNVKSSYVLFQELKTSFVKANKKYLTEEIEEFIVVENSLTAAEILDAIEVGVYHYLTEYYYEICKERINTITEDRFKYRYFKSLMYKFYKIAKVTNYGYMSKNTIKYSKALNNFHKIPQDFIVSTFNDWMNPSEEEFNGYSDEEKRALVTVRENKEYYFNILKERAL